MTNNEVLSSALRERFGRQPQLFIRTYGCQQNVADSEKIRGLMEGLGCIVCDDPSAADIVIFNTCAVRGHAEDRVFGNIGAMKSVKTERPEVIVIMGGCMVQQPHIADSIRKSYPYVDIIFNTNNISELPDRISGFLDTGKRLLDPSCSEYTLNEGIPAVRDMERCRAYLPIMYGCNNFCSYCVVPLVRGRERSRRPEDVVKEFRECVQAGCKDIMLLGQNVNSYGNNSGFGVDFPDLLRMLNDVEGDFVIRFMTSHPKNASKKLFDTIAECGKISRHIHLPVQSGSDRILKLMNRNYTREQYMELINYARSVIPDVYFTSDIIVGFPGETEEEYLQTCSLIEEANYYATFSFIYSKREGTPAAKMPDDTPHSVKAQRLNALNEIQRKVTEKLELGLVGTRQRGICTGYLQDGTFECRINNNAEVTVTGSAEINSFCDITITDYINRRLYGKAE
jgi:tRNA-N(6)-(isopentenyl)adenosine-37 thiotransferase enzyme MiaB